MVHTSFWSMQIVNILRGASPFSFTTVKENGEALVVVSMETGQEVNADKSK